MLFENSSLTLRTNHINTLSHININIPKISIKIIVLKPETKSKPVESYNDAKLSVGNNIITITIIIVSNNINSHMSKNRSSATSLNS